MTGGHTFHFDAIPDPDPSFQIKASNFQIKAQNLKKVLK
jgi:hypothetical protein